MSTTTILAGSNSFGVLPHCSGNGFQVGDVGSGSGAHNNGSITGGSTQYAGHTIEALSYAAEMFPILTGSAGFVFAVVGTVASTILGTVSWTDSGGSHTLNASAATFDTTSFPGFSYWCWVTPYVSIIGTNVTFTLLPPATPLGQGDVPNPQAWNSVTPTLGLGTVAGPTRQGGLNGEAGSPTDPDSFFGSFTLQAVAPTLGTGTVAGPKGQGDIGDVYGTPDASVQPPQLVAGLIAWNSVAPTLGLGTVVGPKGQGDIESVGMSPTPLNEWNDSNAGAGTLVAWNGSASTLGLGSLPVVKPQGDIDAIYAPTEQWAGVNSTWQSGTPTLGMGTLPAVAGAGDIFDPFAWKDAATGALPPKEWSPGNGNGG